MFQTRLIISDTAEPDIWIVERPLIWLDPVFGMLTVPGGFYTDLASIPRIFRNLPDLDPAGYSRRPAVVHDYLYATQTKPKAFADDFLRASLRAEGAPRMSAAAFYYAVHWFGGPSWRSDGAKLPIPPTPKVVP